MAFTNSFKRIFLSLKHELGKNSWSGQYQKNAFGQY